MDSAGLFLERKTAAGCGGEKDAERKRTKVLGDTRGQDVAEQDVPRTIS